MSNQIHVAQETNPIYSPTGHVLTQKKIDPPPQVTDQGIQMSEDTVPQDYPEDGNVEKLTLYRFDSWVFRGHRIDIVGVYDQNGYVQGAMYVADHDGTPHSLIKPEEEKGVLFERLCSLLGIKSHVDDEG